MRRLRLNETRCGAPLKSFGALRRGNGADDPSRRARDKLLARMTRIKAWGVGLTFLLNNPLVHCGTDRHLMLRLA